MAFYANTFEIQGRIVRNAEFTTSSEGLKIARFAVAHNRYWKKEDGTFAEEVSFFPFVIFGNRVDSVGPYLTKGRLVRVEGRLKQNRWESEGTKHSETELVVEKIGLGPNPVKPETDGKLQNPSFPQIPQNQTAGVQMQNPVPQEMLLENSSERTARNFSVETFVPSFDIF